MCTQTNRALLTFIISSEILHDLCPLSICSISLPHSLHLNPVSGARLEGGQSVGGVTVGRLGDIDGAILGGVGHSEGVALGVAGWPGDTQSGGCPACQSQGRDGYLSILKKRWVEILNEISTIQLSSTWYKSRTIHTHGYSHVIRNIQWQYANTYIFCSNLSHYLQLAYKMNI